MSRRSCLKEDLEAAFLDVIAQENADIEDDLSTDEKVCSAFYYAIKYNKLNGLQDLISLKKYTENIINTKLYAAYRELKLKNIQISHQMELSVLHQLTIFKFLKDIPKKVKRDCNNLELIFNAIVECSTQLVTESIDQSFFTTASFLCQNIYSLKRSLSYTYDSIPWEEMEFCLIIFIYSRTKRDKNNILYKTVLSEQKLKTYLKSFAKCVNDNIPVRALNPPPQRTKKAPPPFLNRQQLVESVKAKSPGKFDDMYADFECVRDIFTLDQINHKIKLAVEADPYTYRGKMAVTRCLQFIGESVKNTRDSPKLSDDVAMLIETSAPQNTKEIITSLRNSISHGPSLTRRVDIEDQAKDDYFIRIQNDIVKIKNATIDILYKYRTNILKLLLETILDSEELSDIRRHLQEMENHFDDFFIPNKKQKLTEQKRIEDLMEKLVDMVKKHTHMMYIKTVMDKIETILKEEKTNDNPSSWHAFNTYLLNFSVNERSCRLFKKVVRLIYEDLYKDHNRRRWEEIKLLLFTLYRSINSHNRDDVDDDILKEILMITYIIDSEVTNVESIRKFKEKLSKHKTETKMTNLPEVPDPTRNVKQIPNTKEGVAKSLLRIKINNLKELLEDVEKELENSANNNFELCLGLEMLVLDIMIILNDSLKVLKADNIFVLFDNPPILYGKCFRNYAAHDNSLLDIMSVDPWKTTLSNAKILAALDTENLLNFNSNVNYDHREIRKEFVKDSKIVSAQLQLSRALQNGQGPTELQHLIADGADVDFCNHFGKTALHLACESDNLESVEWMLNRRIDVHSKDIYGSTALHVAAAHNRYHIVKRLLEEVGSDVNDKNAKGQTPLHLAAMKGHKKIVRILISHGANPNDKDNGNNSPVNFAIFGNHLEIIQLLLEYDDGNTKRNALCFAIDSGNLDIITYIIDNYFDGIMCEDPNDRYSCLKRAIIYGHTEIAKLLVSRGSDINGFDSDIETPLHFAFNCNETEIAKHLLEKGASVHIRDKNKESTPLHAAVSLGDRELVEDILNRGADVDAVMGDNLTSLHLAILNNHENVFETLLERKATVEVFDYTNSTLLHFAAHSGNVNILQILIDKDKQLIHSRDLKHRTPSHLAICTGNDKILEILLKNGANVNDVADDRIPPLIVAIKCGHINVCRVLLDWNVEYDIPFVFLPLHTAAGTGNTQILELLLQRGIGKVQDVDVHGRTPLDYSISLRHNDCVRLLLEAGANLNARDVNISSPLELAINFNDHTMFAMLLRKRIEHDFAEDLADIKELLLYVSDEEKMIWISKAASGGNVNMLRYILQNSTIEMDSEEVVRCFHASVCSGYREVVNTFIDCGMPCDAQYKDETALFKVSFIGHKDMVIDLIAAGADVNFRNDEGVTPLHMAVQKQNVEIASCLLAAGAKVDARDYDIKMTPLESTIVYYNDNLEIVQTLVESGNNVDLNTSVHMGLPLVQICILRDNISVAKYLLEQGADVCAKNTQGLETLHYAASMGRHAFVQYLITKRGVQVDRATQDKCTALHFAARGEDVKTVHVLIQNGADVNAVTDHFLTPLNMAIDSNRESAVKLLLNNGAIVNTEAKLSSFDRLNVRRLIEPTIDLFLQINGGDIQRCIDEGSFLNARNEDGFTPLLLAIQNNNETVVKLLLNNNADPNMTGNGRTALCEASQNNLRDVVLLLLSHGAIYNVKDSANNSPLEYTNDVTISDMLRSIDGYFQNVRDNVGDFIEELKSLPTAKLKAVMNARIDESKTKLVPFAITHNFGDVQKLMDVQGEGWMFIINTLESTRYFDFALKLLDKILIKRRQIFDANSPTILNILKRKAKIQFKMEMYNVAINTIEEVYKKEKMELGAKNKTSLETGKQLVKYLNYRKEHGRAMIYCAEIFESLKKLYGSNSRTALEVQLILSNILIELKMYEDALKILNRLYYKDRKLNARDYLTVLDNMAKIHINKDDRNLAGDVYKKAAEFSQRISGPQHLQTLYYLKQMYTIKEEYAKAVEVCESALKIMKPDDPNLVTFQYGIQLAAEFLNTTPKIESIITFDQVIRAIAKNDYCELYGLLERGFDVNRKFSEINLLYYAVRSGCDISTFVLLEKGADPFTIIEDGTTMLVGAVYSGSRETLKVLLDYVKVNHGGRFQEFLDGQRGFVSWSAVHVACLRGLYDIVQALVVDYGASTRSVDLMGKTPMDYGRDDNTRKILGRNFK